MKIRTLVVDDMRLARRRLVMCLAADPEIEVVGECANGREAIAAVRRLAPDLVFLDVQMPKVSGFDVIEAVGAENMPAVVFVTAYDEFALRAFDVSAIDYLLKPFDEGRLERAIARVKRRIRRGGPDGLEERLARLLAGVAAPKYLKRLTVKTSGHILILPVEEIDWLGAAGNYVEVHAGRQTHLVRESISNLEGKLDPEEFVRIHRSTIVNIERVRELHPLFNDDHVVVLRDGTRLNLSRTYYHKLPPLL
jgi:two-component system LytT family response regulator